MEDIEMIDSSKKEDSIFWKKFISWFVQMKISGRAFRFVHQGFRVIDEEVIREMVKIDNDKRQNLSNYTEFPLDWIVTKNLEIKNTNSKLKDQFEYEFDKLLKLIDQESINE